MPTYRHNDYYGYINKVQEKAISNPQWFWGDTSDASEARQWLYNNGASSIVENIYNNTPEEFRSTINSKYLPTSVHQSNFNNGITTATDKAARTIGKGVLAAGSVGMMGAGLLPVFTEGWTAGIPMLAGLAGSGFGSLVGGELGATYGALKTLVNDRWTPKDKHYLENEIPVVSGWNKSWKAHVDRFTDDVLKYGGYGAIAGGLLGGAYGGIRGAHFIDVVNNGWPRISRNIMNFHKNFGHNIEFGNSGQRFESIPIRIGTGRGGSNVTSRWWGKYHPLEDKIELSGSIRDVLNPKYKFSSILSHEGEHAAQLRIPKFSKIENGYYTEIPEQPVSTMFEHTLGKYPKGSWFRSPDEFDAEMAYTRELTKQNKPYSQMGRLPRWITKRYMKNRFGLNDSTFDVAVKAQELALKDPWQSIEGIKWHIDN